MLTVDLPDDALQAGDVGTVIHIHPDAKAYQVEFVTLTGQTVAAQVPPLQQGCAKESSKGIEAAMDEDLFGAKGGWRSNSGRRPIAENVFSVPLKR